MICVNFDKPSNRWVFILGKNNLSIHFFQYIEYINIFLSIYHRTYRYISFDLPSLRALRLVITFFLVLSPGEFKTLAGDLEESTFPEDAVVTFPQNGFLSTSGSGVAVSLRFSLPVFSLVGYK